MSAPDPAPLATLGIAVLGTGAVGSALARSLERAGPSRFVRVWSRDGDVGVALDGADVVLVCVGDNAIQEVARRCADDSHRLATGAVILHTSGFLGTAPLAPLATAGFGVGSLHPLVSVPSGADAACFAGAHFAVDGDADARARARDLVHALGGHAIELADAPGATARYHTAAALLANGAVALFDAAEELLADALRAPEDERRRALAGLLASVAAGLREHAPEAALTGPLSRGDERIVAGHLACLADEPELGELYRRLSRRMLRLARRRGRVPAARLDGIEALLDRPGSSGG